MKKEKRIYKYPTGAVVPEGAIYLGTVIQTNKYTTYGKNRWVDCWYVWHYFLVEVEISPKKPKVKNKS